MKKYLNKFKTTTLFKVIPTILKKSRAIYSEVLDEHELAMTQ